MYRMFFLAGAVLLSMTSLALADDRREQAMERMQEHLAAAQDRLQLTDQQMEQMRPIIAEATEQRLEIVARYAQDENGERRRPSRDDMRAMRDELQVVNDRAQASLSQVLSEEQMGEFRQMQQELREEMRKQAMDRRSRQ